MITVLALLTAANAQPTAPGRVSELVGELLVRGPYDTTSVLVTRNAVIRPGDELKTPFGSFAEVELEPGTFLRLAGGTSAAVDRVDDRQLVVVIEGAVSVERGERGGPVSVVALGGRVALDQGSRCRVTLDRDELRVEVRATRGYADLVTDAASERLSPGEAVAYLPGVKERSQWSQERDAFDGWVDERHQRVAERRLPRTQTDSYVGSYDLHDHGSWVTFADGPAWRPHVGERWRPYLRGSWSWTEPYGWVWVPVSAWEYVTHHYGRWINDARLGWLWLPGRDWAPANVAWAMVGPYVAWAPSGHHHHHYGNTDVWVFADLAYFWAGGGWAPRGSCGRILDRDSVAHYGGTPVDSPSEDLAPRDPSKPDPINLLARRLAMTPKRMRAHAAAEQRYKPVRNAPRPYTRGRARAVAVELGAASSFDRRVADREVEEAEPEANQTRARYSGVRMPVTPRRSDNQVVTVVRRRAARPSVPRTAAPSAPPRPAAASSAVHDANAARIPVRPEARVRAQAATPTRHPAARHHAPSPASRTRATPTYRPSAPAARIKPSDSASRPSTRRPPSRSVSKPSSPRSRSSRSRSYSPPPGSRSHRPPPSASTSRSVSKPASAATSRSYRPPPSASTSRSVSKPAPSSKRSYAPPKPSSPSRSAPARSRRSASSSRSHSRDKR